MTRRHLLLCLVPASLGCREPTQVTLVVRTNEPCADVAGTSISVGQPGTVDMSDPVSVTASCDAGAIGTLVLAPTHGANERLGVLVAMTLDGGACPPPTWGPTCIVQRRLVSFEAHSSLSVAIDLDNDCVGISCDPNSTCYRGSCFAVANFDPDACDAGRCAPVDAGGAADAGKDAGDAAVDASGTPSEAGVPASKIQCPGNPPCDPSAQHFCCATMTGYACGSSSSSSCSGQQIFCSSSQSCGAGEICCPLGPPSGGFYVVRCETEVRCTSAALCQPDDICPGGTRCQPSTLLPGFTQCL
jgi:hypothetical protein